jgi:hypothetical protein
MRIIWNLWDTVAADPVTLAAALMMAAAVLALGLIATPSRDRKTRNNSAARPATARTMAAKGAAPTDIARRTGLSRDAVAMLLASVETPTTRKGRPAAARFAVAGTGMPSAARPDART